MISAIKKLVKSVPVLGPFLVSVKGGQFKGSADYWDRRYRSGGISGAGSRNRLAEFKADFLNNFVAEQKIDSVIELGCGDGFQLKLARYSSYIGVDVSLKAVELCRAAFAGDTSKTFLTSDALRPGTTADMSLSLDVIYHLVEDSVYEAYMQQLFECARRFVIVYASNIDRQSPDVHVRHRQFTRWIEQNKPEWLLHSKLANAYPWDPADPQQTSFADFYVFARR